MRCFNSHSTQLLFTALYLLASFETAQAQQTTIRQYLCTGSNVFLANETQVVSLLDSILITSTLNNKKGPVSFPQRRQCGVEGEHWRICTSCTEKKSDFGYESVLPFLADPQHRNWHMMWHKIRREISGDGINSIDAEPQVVTSWQKSGWIPMDVETFRENHRLGGYLAGEDFFYMHRQMIKMIQIELANQGAPCIAPWKELPRSVMDSTWRVPRTKLANQNSQALITAEQAYLNEIHRLTNEILSPERLRTISLSQLGSEVEVAIHGKLHLLYADPINRCPNPETDNRVECDELTHDRTAHLNIHFWKLHGFIDSIVGKWLQANQYDMISEDCSSVRNARCYQWKGTWLGQLPN